MASFGDRVWNYVRGLQSLLFTPQLLIAPSPERYYEFLGDDVIEGHGAWKAHEARQLWMNLGDWQTARSYSAAAAALAMRVGDAAKLGPGDHVLDVGFGFAEQDLLWLERYGVKQITGVNITERQVEVARARVAARGFAERIDLHVGSATQLAFADGTFDKVTALECAHHFDTRERFFAEAFRVLAPGGRLVTADGATSEGDGKLSFAQRITLRRWSVPLANMYTREEYGRRLERAGFTDVRCESIRNYVFPGSVKYETLRHRGVPREEAVIELSEQEIADCVGLEYWRLTGFTDYLVAVADKPRQSPAR